MKPVLFLAFLVLGCRGAPVRPFPRHVQTLAGRVEVVRVVDPIADGEPVLGAWYWDKRQIVVAANVPSWVAWHTLHHEMCHANFDAAGLTHLHDGAEQEAICDAMASGQMMQRTF